VRQFPNVSNLNLRISARGFYFKFRRRRGAGTDLTLNQGGGAYFIFPKSWSDIIVFFLQYMYVSVPQKSRKDPVSREELHNIMTPLTGLGLLHKVGWASGNESADLHHHPLRRSIRSA